MYMLHRSAMGADFNQTVKAIAEAEAYPGPSLIIAYAPCINHGIKKGMSKAQTEEQLAVECGYWNNFRFNPAAEGSKFTPGQQRAQDRKTTRTFLNGEVRYTCTGYEAIRRKQKSCLQRTRKRQRKDTLI